MQAIEESGAPLEFRGRRLQRLLSPTSELLRGWYLNVTRLEIAGLLVEVSADVGLPPIGRSRAHLPFLAEVGKRRADVLVRAHVGPAPERGESELLFSSARLWRLTRGRGGRELTVLAPHLGGEVHAQVWIPEGVERVPPVVDLWLNPPPGGFGDRLPALDYPLDELLFGQLLARGAGLIVHSSAVRLRGRGLLFPGTSGVGKSTLSQVLIDAAEEEKGRGQDGGIADLEVLSDDRNVVRVIDGVPWVFGTPWHGDVDKVADGGAPLERILFLEHGEENRFRAIDRVEAAATLMARSFPPYWEAEQLDLAAGLVEGIVGLCPPERFSFVPDRGVVGALGLGR